MSPLPVIVKMLAPLHRFQGLPPIWDLLSVAAQCLLPGYTLPPPILLKQQEEKNGKQEVLLPPEVAKEEMQLPTPVGMVLATAAGINLLITYRRKEIPPHHGPRTWRGMEGKHPHLIWEQHGLRRHCNVLGVG